MLKTVGRILAMIVGFYVLIALVVFGYGYLSKRVRAQISHDTVIQVNLEAEIVEYAPDSSLLELTGTKAPTLFNVVRSIDRAAEDERVRLLVAKVGEGGLGLAQIQELRDAVMRFRSTGKKAVAWAESFGDFGPGNRSYYLATAFDEIYLQPGGMLGLTGFVYESPFIKGTLAKLGVEPQLDRRSEYKNAVNIFTKEGFDGPHREALTTVMESQFSQFVSGISAGRGLEPEQVRGIIDDGPYLSGAALELGLVDGVAYKDEVYDKIEEELGVEPDFLLLGSYAERVGYGKTGPDTIALIYGVGAVDSGRSEADPIFGGVRMGSATVSAAFRSAVEADSVKAIVFRIDSPGGKVVPSDTIWRETVRAREAGKPVIVSMGNVAGSGGYWIAMDADSIVAQPSTITGSIGVFAGKMYTTGMWDKLGVKWEDITSSGNARMWMGTNRYSEGEWAKLQILLDGIYDDFTTRVAKGRGLTKERVLEIARGRIWTGEDAKELGLVDETGGIMDAIAIAKEAAGIPAGEKVGIRTFPRKKSLSESILMFITGRGDEELGAMVGYSSLRSLRRVAGPVRDMAVLLSGGAGVVHMPVYTRGLGY